MGEARQFILEAFTHAKTIGATNEGVDLLEACMLPGVALAGTQTTAQLHNQMGVLSIRNAADMGKLSQNSLFSQEFINAVAQHRHWERESLKNQVSA